MLCLHLHLNNEKKTFHFFLFLFKKNNEKPFEGHPNVPDLIILVMAFGPYKSI